MKKFDDLEKLIQFILRKHPDLKSTRSGVRAWKMLRKPNGTRMPIESMQGFKIINFNIFDENILTIEQLAAGYGFHNKIKQTLSSILYLRDLAVINVYDQKTEFYSLDSIDFVYAINSYESKIIMMQEWFEKEQPILRGQWTSSDGKVEKILDEISVGRSIVQSEESRRLIDWR